ncbi:MAG: Hsp33 family molecular chaperone HslO [Spirochaetia bacterium]|jgi:molecular chaperone Hsp33|nr:Hsp33 family molecular chaperone HslO [Spirochaetia bacterium]
MLPVTISDPELAARLESLPADGLTIFTLEGDSIRGALVSGTRMVTLMRQSHELGLLETLLLGKAYIAAALLSATIKGDDRLSLKVDGDGPARGYLAECTAAGQVRGRLFTPAIDIGDDPADFDTGRLIGKGQLSITRYMVGKTEPVTGTVALRTGRLAEDLAWFYHLSEQTRTSFTLGVHFDAKGRVAGAGGLYLQALPGAKDEVLDRVERLVYSLPPLGETFATGAGRMDICLRSFPFFDLNLLDEHPVSFDCPCTKERIAAFISALSKAELTDMAAAGNFPVEVRCHNCGSVYRFDREEFMALAGSRVVKRADGTQESK